MLLRLIFLCAIILGPIRAAQQLVPPLDGPAKVDRIFSTFTKTGSPGCTVGAAIDGATVLSAAYGMADLERNVPLTPQSVVEAGSVSKQFTAGVVLLLAQQGKLSLDDPVRKYIPELPDYGTVITIRHLLNHTSGLREVCFSVWPGESLRPESPDHHDQNSLGER
jgi:CubicO group peptidase (beta-lactamase class C family)